VREKEGEIKHTAILNCAAVGGQSTRVTNSLLILSILFRTKFNKQIPTNFIDLCSINVDSSDEKGQRVYTLKFL
jgi:hypothetical protein